MFGPDVEGLLPMHYYSERHDKDQHLDLMQYVLQANPSSKAHDDTTLFSVDPDPNAVSGWRGAIRSMWGGAKTTAPVASIAVSQTTTAVPSTTPAPATVVHNRRKSVRPIRGSIHEQYKK